MTDEEKLNWGERTETRIEELYAKFELMAQQMAKLANDVCALVIQVKELQRKYEKHTHRIAIREVENK